MTVDGWNEHAYRGLVPSGFGRYSLKNYSKFELKSMFFCLNMNFIWKVFVEKHYSIKKPIRNSIFVLSKYSCKCLGNTEAYLYGRKLILMIRSIGGRDRYRFFEPEPIAELEPVDRFLPVLFLLADSDEKKKYGICPSPQKERESGKTGRPVPTLTDSTVSFTYYSRRIKEAPTAYFSQ